MVALVESVRFERRSKRNRIATELSEVAMMSVGTGQQPTMPYDVATLSDVGQIYWAIYICDVMFESQSFVAHFQTEFLLREKYRRMNPLLGFPMALDDLNHLAELKNISDINAGDAAFLKKYIAP
jgi:uncharacterized protein